jgi:hypothetical protein
MMNVLTVAKPSPTVAVGWGLNIPAKETTLQMKTALGQWLGQKNYLV